MQVFSASQAISPAIERTRSYLFRPFRWSTYLKLCTVAVLTEGFGGNFNFSSPGNSSHGSGIPSQTPFHITSFEIALIVIAVAVCIALGIYILYLITRLRFAFFHCLIHQTKEIRPGWRLYREHAMRFFELNLVIGLVFLCVVVVLAVPFVLAFIHLFKSSGPGSHFNILGFVSLLLPLILIVLALVLVGVAVDIILRDFMLPHVALENTTARAAWSAVRARIAAEKGAFLFYAFLRVVIPVAAMMCLILILIIPMIILVLIVVAIVAGLHALLAGSSGASAFFLIPLAAIFVLACICFAVLLGISLGGPVSTWVRNYSLLFYGGRFPLLGDILVPPPPPPPAPLDASDAPQPA
jgi:hypothetical protein